MSSGWHTFFDDVTIQGFQKQQGPVLQALLSCQCNDFVSMQLINIEVIHVVWRVVIIENTVW